MNYLKNSLIACVLAFGLVLNGCVTTTVNPDGSTSVSEPDYESIQLLSTAAIAAWAASQKDGLKPQDAEVILKVMSAIENFHKDGTPLDEGQWSGAIAQQVPKRWQGVAIVLVQLTKHELDKYGVLDQIPTEDSVGGKIMKAIVTGVRMGVAPYMGTALS